eukprot:1341890-Prymnesium_polylepis.1
MTKLLESMRLFVLCLLRCGFTQTPDAASKLDAAWALASTACDRSSSHHHAVHRRAVWLRLPSVRAVAALRNRRVEPTC